MTQVREIVENFPDLVRLERGSGDHPVGGLQEPSIARSEDLIFVSSAAHLKTALTSKSAAWVVHTGLTAQVPPAVKVVLSSANVQLCMALFAKKFFPLTKNHMIVEGPRVSKSAVVSASAKIGKDCIIAPGAVIGDNCVIGDGTIIGANAVIEPFAKVGSHTHIHPLVFVGHSCEIGNHCEIKPNTTIGGEGFGYAQDKQVNHHRLTHYGRVIVEDHVHIGAGVQIDRGTFLDSRIGQQTKIDNHCHFGHNIVIGKNTVITGGMITAGSCTIGSYNVFGGRTSIAGHLTVGDRIQIGGLSGITKSVTEPGQYAGFPLQDLKNDMRTRASLKMLPKLVKQMRMVLNKLGIEADKDE